MTYLAQLKVNSKFGKLTNIVQTLNKLITNKIGSKPKKQPSFLDVFPFGMIVFLQNGQIFDLNDEARKIIEVDNEEEQKNYSIFTDTTFMNSSYAHLIKDTFEDGNTLITLPMNISINRYGYFAKSKSIWLILRFYKLNTILSSEFKIICLIENITEYEKSDPTHLKLAKQDIRSKATLETVENERKRIARDLHDELGQNLTYVRMRLELLRDKVKNYEFEFSELVQIIFVSNSRLSHIIHDLRPKELDEFGLKIAIELLIDKITHARHVNIDYHYNGLPRKLNRDIELTIFRITQESLSNMVKHSSFKNASIKIYKKNNIIYVSIEDDGTGMQIEIDNDLPDIKKGYGFLNMYERIVSVGGKLYVKSSPGEGMKINIEIPLNKNV